MRFFFHIGYNGYHYHGWQRQSAHLSVQEVIENSLSRILKMPVTIMGCGRTDARVHASQYFFHIDAEKEWGFDLQFRLNKILPGDIAIFNIFAVPESSHAQFDARQRTYDYFIHTRKDPFLSQVSSLYLEKELRLDKMKRAMDLLVQYKDYRSFCKSPDQYKHTLCNLSFAGLYSDERGERLRLRFTSDRFLQGMIRAIVAKLLDVARGKLAVAELEAILIRREASQNLEFAYPQGLHLSRVVYPYLNLPSQTHADFLLRHSQTEWIEA